MAISNGGAQATERDDVRERLHRLALGLDILPPITRAVFLLHRIDDLSYEQVAWRCGIGIDEVTIRMADALTGLRRSADGDIPLMGRLRWRLLPWRSTWARWRMRR